MRVMADFIPMDPVDVEDLPPADIDACDRCAGHGEVVTGTDPISGRWVAETCPACDGTGDRWGRAA